MTALTTDQQQRMEALNAAASLLVDRTVTGAATGFLSKSDESMKADGMLASDATAAIEMAHYIVAGPFPNPPAIVFDEDGTRIQQKEEA